MVVAGIYASSYGMAAARRRGTMSRGGYAGFANRGQGDDWPNQYEKISEEFRVEVLRSICVINLNKSPGTHTTKIAKLKKIATEDAVLIQSQYAIYDPDLTICGGTGDPAGDFCTSESERESHGGGQGRCQCRGTNRNRS